MTVPERSGSEDGGRLPEGKPRRKGLRRRLAKALLGFDGEQLREELIARVDTVQAAFSRDLARTAGELRESLAQVQQGFHESLVELQRELETLRDLRLPEAERRLDGAEEALRRLQQELEALRDGRVSALEGRMDAAEGAARVVAATVEEVRDERLPAAVRRADLLVDRLARRIEELGSLVERCLAREPLPVPAASPDENRIAEALAELGPRLLHELRGSEEEIGHRMEAYLPLLAGREPVLDLGCGRGELLDLLRERGMEATGIEADPALAAAARRRGLRVVEGEVLEVLLRLGDGSVGAVAAIHLLEHLPLHELLRVLAEVRRVLRPGGVFLAECPNPASLRVGAHEFWLDPTHVRPLPARLLELLVTGSGFEVIDRRFLRPFPEDQRLPEVAPPGGDAVPGLGELAAAVEAVQRRLDDLINGPRDYLLVARRSD